MIVWATGVVRVALDGHERAGWQSVVGLAVVLVGSLVLTSPGDDDLPVVRASIVAAVPVVNAALLLPTLPVAHDEVWLLDISAYLAALLMVRGSVALGWIGGGALLMGLLTWITVHRPGAPEAFELVVQPAIALAIGTVWRRLLVRTTSRITAYRAAQLRAQLQAEVTRDATARSRARLVAVQERAAPLLHEIVESGGLSPDDRARAREVEAGLRDELRAPTLAVAPVTRAVALARRRGVDVLLLDDRGPGAGPVDSRILGEVAALVEGLRRGRATVRALPPGRDHAVTVVVDDGDRTERHEFDDRR
ncbi:hypothetical protein H1Q78_15045 [Cellulosimicrobium cellulans]|uniref:hypothetical protein n=1 Tax=Cellulosimicrobium cellulans TaxID=1710 RepID=UPI001EDAFE3E|nr:hypothetical protein [Cellulosimicrobium cellulans]UKJ63015.1 hypothetical protein H1Q78_15045 [Cellulosimicrobium cellulans]